MFGRTKQKVRDKLKALRADLDAGLKPSPTYTVAQAVEDWLRDGLDGRAERTRTLYEGLMRSLMEHLGGRPLRNLSASDVRWAMTQLEPRFSSRSLQITRNCLERAITHAQANDLVARNVAALATLPKGRAGRPSKSFTVEQARAVLAAAAVHDQPQGDGGAGVQRGLRVGNGRGRWERRQDRSGDRPGAADLHLLQLLVRAGDVAGCRAGLTVATRLRDFAYPLVLRVSTATGLPSARVGGRRLRGGQ